MTLIISEKGFSTETKINVNLAQLGVNDLESYILDLELLEKFKEDQVIKHQVIPLFAIGNKVYVSIADPKNIDAQQMIVFSSGYNQIRNIEGIA